MDASFPEAGESAGRGEDRRQVWKISELTRRIKGTLEGAFGSVWVEGEISNLRRPASGHAYFTLKDAKSVLKCVLFKGRGAPSALFEPVNGNMVSVGGRIAVYE